MVQNQVNKMSYLFETMARQMRPWLTAAVKVNNEKTLQWCHDKVIMKWHYKRRKLVFPGWCVNSAEGILFISIIFYWIELFLLPILSEIPVNLVLKHQNVVSKPSLCKNRRCDTCGSGETWVPTLLGQSKRHSDQVLIRRTASRALVTQIFLRVITYIVIWDCKKN